MKWTIPRFLVSEDISTLCLKLDETFGPRATFPPVLQQLTIKQSCLRSAERKQNVWWLILDKIFNVSPSLEDSKTCLDEEVNIALKTKQTQQWGSNYLYSINKARLIISLTPNSKRKKMSSNAATSHHYFFFNTITLLISQQSHSFRKANKNKGLYFQSSILSAGGMQSL